MMYDIFIVVEKCLDGSIKKLKEQNEYHSTSNSKKLSGTLHWRHFD